MRYAARCANGPELGACACPVIRIADCRALPAWIGIAKTEKVSLSPRAPSTLSELKPRFTRPGLFLSRSAAPEIERRANLVRIPFNEYKESNSFPRFYKSSWSIGSGLF